MLTISQEQALKRWDVITPPLREALFSDINADFVEKLCASQHLPEAKALDVAGISGYVLLGFLHPEDLAGELKDEIGLDQQTSKAIADGINTRVFAPIRQEIDKVYNPVRPLNGAKIAQDIRPAAAPAPMSGPKIISQTASGAAVVGTSVVAGSPMRTAAPPPMPAAPAKKLDESGWSRSTQSQPVVRLTATSPQMPQPPSSVQKVSPLVPKGPPIPAKSAMGEFERMGFSGGVPKAGSPPTPGAATPPAIPAPMIIHEDAVFKAGQKSSEFRIQLPVEQFNMQKGPTPASARDAVLELGKATPSPSTAPSSSAIGPMTSSPRSAVHYTDYKPTTRATPSSPAMPRQVTELTSPSAPQLTMTPKSVTVSPPAPAAPPRPTPPPPPPKPAATPVVPTPTAQNKVIHQDYS